MNNGFTAVSYPRSLWGAKPMRTAGKVLSFLYFEVCSHVPKCGIPRVECSHFDLHGEDVVVDQML